MTTFTVGCIQTKVQGLIGKGLGYVKQAMTAKPAGYRFMAAYKAGHWDGNICLYKDNTFPSGLLFLATQELDEANIAYDILNMQPSVDIKLDLDLAGYNLRDYQIEAIKAALDYQRGILKLATNAGKTLVTAGIIKSTGCDALVVVPTKPLLHQTSEYYTKVLHESVGMVGDGFSEYDKPIVVTTMASFHKVAAIGRSFNTLILDECHHGKAKSISDPASYIEAPIRIGVSGTPLSYDELNDLTLMGITGPLLYEVSNTDLIEGGYSVKPVIIFHEISEPELPKKKSRKFIVDKQSYAEVYNLSIVNNLARNAKIASIALDGIGLTLILVERLEHVANLLELIPGSIPATGDEDTTAILNNMRQSKYKTVIATNVFSEGVDVEGIDSIILAGAGVSHIRLLQRIGRGLRVSHGKSEVIIHDFIDSNSSYLLEQSDQRLTTYEKEGFEVRLED